jgi:hypothetical protein
MTPDEFIARAVAEAPPLTADQRARVAYWLGLEAGLQAGLADAIGEQS